MSQGLINRRNVRIPSFTVTVSLLPAYDAENNDLLPGPPLAESLRRIADEIEENLNVVPYPGSTEWTTEDHPVIHKGKTIGAYRLHRV